MFFEQSINICLVSINIPLYNFNPSRYIPSKNPSRYIILTLMFYFSPVKVLKKKVHAKCVHIKIILVY